MSIMSAPHEGQQSSAKDQNSKSCYRKWPKLLAVLDFITRV